MSTPQEELEALKAVNNAVGMSGFFNHADLSIARSAIESVKAIALGEKDHNNRQALLVRCMETLRHPDVTMRLTAVQILGAMYEEGFVKASIDAMYAAASKFQQMTSGLGMTSNEVSPMFVQMAKGLEEDLNNSPAYPPLTLMLTDPDDTVRQAAMEALRTIKLPKKKWSLFGKRK